MKTLLVLIVAIFSLGITSTAFAQNDSYRRPVEAGLTEVGPECTECAKNSIRGRLHVPNTTVQPLMHNDSGNSAAPGATKGNGAVD